MPDLRLRTETEAVNLIIAAGLALGTRTRGVRRDRARGLGREPAPGPGRRSSAKGTPGRLRRLAGPRATPRPSRRPRPRRHRPPTPPPPTPTPEPPDLTVGDYRCRAPRAWPRSRSRTTASRSGASRARTPTSRGSSGSSRSPARSGPPAPRSTSRPWTSQRRDLSRRTDLTGPAQPSGSPNRLVRSPQLGPAR